MIPTQAALMASLLAIQVAILSVVSVSMVSSLPLPLFLYCNQSSMSSASISSLRNDHVSSFIQCRQDLSPYECTLCVQNARRTTYSLCPEASFITAWFDGCYVQFQLNNRYSHRHVSGEHLEISYSLCSNHTTSVYQNEFEIALQVSLLRLRVNLYIATHHGFSTTELQYGNGSKIYALAECVKHVPTKECEMCVSKGIEKLYGDCGGKDGGTAVTGYCIVRYESYSFFFSYSETNGNSNRPESDVLGVISVSENGKEEDYLGFNGRLACGVGAAFLVLVVFSAWLLWTTLVNKAKVGPFEVSDDGNAK